MAETTDDTEIVIPPDDAVVVFRTVKSGARGRLVRLGATADAVIAAHDLPDSVSETLCQALSLAALAGSTLPSDGKLILQTRTDGPLSLLVADFEAQGRLRGYARFDAAALEALGPLPLAREVLGAGHMALTLDPGAGEERYQGVIELSGRSLSKAASDYFENREGLPTFLRLASAAYANARDAGRRTWRTGGLMVQSLVQRTSDDDVSDNWNRARLLAETVAYHELVDPSLSPERLLLRLFHEEGVRVERALPLVRYCRCSRERVADVLNSFGVKELSDMRNEDGKVVVTCEFCATAYPFELSEIEAK